MRPRFDRLRSRWRTGRRWWLSWSRSAPLIGPAFRFRDLVAREVRRAAAFEVLSVAWLVGYTFMAPPMARAALGSGVGVLLVAAAGGVVALVVMLVREVRPFPSGASIELSGLYLLGAGPLLHALAVLTIILESGWANYHLVVPVLQSGAVLAAVRMRGAVVLEEIRS